MVLKKSAALLLVVALAAVAIASVAYAILAKEAGTQGGQTVTVTQTVTVATTTVTVTTTVTRTVTATGTATQQPTATTTVYTPSKDIKGLTIRGAGASFQYPQIAHWSKLFKEATGAEVTYQSVGSGAGQRMFLVDRVVDFAASDPPLTKEQYSRYAGQVLQIPWIMGAVAVVYNVPEIPGGHNLRLTANVIARIYRGEIEYWDDPAIKELNPEIADKLPRQQIIAVHRSDSSGTTEIFTTFLNKASPNLWPKELVGKVVDWPVDRTGRGVGAKGNEGVTATVLQTPYSIGYVELSYAIENRLPIAAIRNAAGKFVLPTDESIRNAVRGVKVPESPADDFSDMFYDVIYSPNPDSYPIASVVFIFVWSRYEDRNTALAISEFLRWVAHEGYKHMVTGCVAPPEQVVELLLKAADIIAGTAR